MTKTKKIFTKHWESFIHMKTNKAPRFGKKKRREWGNNICSNGMYFFFSLLFQTKILCHGNVSFPCSKTPF